MGSSGSGSPIQLGADADLVCGHLKDFFTLVSGAWAGTRERPGAAGSPWDSPCLCVESMQSLHMGASGALVFLSQLGALRAYVLSQAEAVMHHSFWRILRSHYTKLQRLTRFNAGTSTSHCRRAGVSLENRVSHGGLLNGLLLLRRPLSHHQFLPRHVGSGRGCLTLTPGSYLSSC